jgi:hypothetical protein
MDGRNSRIGAVALCFRSESVDEDRPKQRSQPNDKRQRPRAAE